MFQVCDMNTSTILCAQMYLNIQCIHYIMVKGCQLLFVCVCYCLPYLRRSQIQEDKHLPDCSEGSSVLLSGLPGQRRDNLLMEEISLNPLFFLQAICLMGHTIGIPKFTSAAETMDQHLTRFTFPTAHHFTQSNGVMPVSL